MNRRLSTGPEESALLTELERREIPVFSTKKHRALLTHLDDRHLYALLDALEDKGWLLRVESGVYVVVPRAARGTWHEHPFIIASAAAPQCYYISYWSALSYHNLTTQMPRIVVIAILAASRSRRRGSFTFQGTHYRFVTRSDATFFGIKAHDLTGLNGAAQVSVLIAEPEKAILDSLDDERLSGGMPEITAAIRRGMAHGYLSLQVLIDNATRYPNRAVIHRLGYILMRSGVDASDLGMLQSLVRRTGYPPYLSSIAPRDGAQRDRLWNLMINIPGTLFEEDA